MPLPLAITPGDPRGVGPEVTCKALALRAHRGQPVHGVLIGDRRALVRAAELVGFDLSSVEVIDLGDEAEPVEVASIRAAVQGIRAGQYGALVTGPIHKARLAARGFEYPGHTDFLGHLCGVDRPVMAFVGGSVRVVLVTVHLPLLKVPAAVTQASVLETIQAANLALQSQLGIPRPKLLVCGLNPHAGDDGLLGTEEIEIIGPATVRAQALGIHAVGPMSAEAAFCAAVAGDGDMVVAMYHDQGLAPLKALDFGRSVNWTLGLPMIRTSVDHGTADDIAWTGRAQSGSMQAAIALAERLMAAAS